MDTRQEEAKPKLVFNNFSACGQWTLSYEKTFHLEFSGNEVYYTFQKILLVKNMLCSKLHYQTTRG